MSVVQITSPGAVLLTVGEGGIVTWSSQYDQYQTHYEIQYKLKDSESWSTLGKIESTEKSANLQDIYTALPREFTEIYYRVVIYYEWRSNWTASAGYFFDKGHEFSETYILLFRPQRDENILVDDIGNIYPLYDEVTDTMIDCAVVRVQEKELKLPIVDETHPLRVMDSNAAGEVLHKYNTGISGTGYTKRNYYYYYTMDWPSYGYYALVDDRPKSYTDQYYYYIPSYYVSPAPGYYALIGGYECHDTYTAYTNEYYHWYGGTRGYQYYEVLYTDSEKQYYVVYQ